MICDIVLLLITLPALIVELVIVGIILYIMGI